MVELSSFQLISMGESPDVAVVTNLSPNHLDVHKDMQEYIDAKKNIFRHQKRLFPHGAGRRQRDHRRPSPRRSGGIAGCSAGAAPVDRGVWCDEESVYVGRAGS